MPAKQKVKKTKPTTSEIQAQKLAEFDRLLGEPATTTTASSSSSTKEATSTKPKRKGGFPAGMVRRPRAEFLVNVMGRKYTKMELTSKVMQVSGKSLITESVIRDNVKRLLHTDKFVDLLPQQKTYSFGSKAVPVVKEHIEYQLTNLLYIANVISVARGKLTLSESDVMLADLIMKGRIGIHGDKQQTQEALIKCQPKAKQNIVLGQDVNIDKVAMILQEALFKEDLSSGSVLGTQTDALKKAIADAERKFHEVLTAEPTKKRKKYEIGAKLEEEQEEATKEQESKDEPAKEVEAKESKEVVEPKPKKKKTEKKTEKKTTKK